MNPANYTPFIDAEGGQWLRFTGTRFKGVVWRPSDIQMTEDGNMSFQVETLEGQGFPEVTAEQWNDFGHCCSKILEEVIAAEAAELQQMAEAFESAEESGPTVTSRAQEILGDGAVQVSDALIPQELQMDMAQIAGVLGGVKPQ